MLPSTVWVIVKLVPEIVIAIVVRFSAICMLPVTVPVPLASVKVMLKVMSAAVAVAVLVIPVTLMVPLIVSPATSLQLVKVVVIDVVTAGSKDIDPLTVQGIDCTTPITVAGAAPCEMIRCTAPWPILPIF